MALIALQPRPITRDGGSLRDDRLFIIACDDTYAPKQYFDFFRLPRVQVHVIPTMDGTSAAAHVLERLLNVAHEDDDELWMLLDTDHCIGPNHIGPFTTALADARRRGVKVALSRPSFEIWLLLHHAEEDQASELRDASEVESRLRTLLGEYNKTALKQRHYPAATVAQACERARRLDRGVAGGEVPSANTTRVYLLWHSMISKALASQLPHELRHLQQE